MDTKALYHLTYGLYLLTAREDGRDNGCIINTAVQVANNPTRLSVAAIKGNLTHDMILRTGKLNLSAISTEAEFSLFQRFGMQSGRNVDKFADFPDVARSENGLLYLTKWCNASLSLQVVDSMDLGSHTLFICELEDAQVLGTCPDCTYSYYQTDIKGKARKPAAKTGWVCSICGWIYEGEELPADIVCPICKHTAEVFERIGGEKKEAPAAQPAAGGSKWVCSICGYVYEGEELPADFVCPICKAPASKFTRQSGELTWAAEHVVGVAADVPEEIKDGLRANFEGECSEVGMYLAMSRAAHREGCPEAGRYYEKAAHEEAEHAAKFAELLGEVVTDSTKENLRRRVEAENGATAGKVELALKAEAAGCEAIRDTVFEMAKDEARHGKAFQGLLKKYFG